jgi:hypothetical protein
MQEYLPYRHEHIHMFKLSCYFNERLARGNEALTIDGNLKTVGPSRYKPNPLRILPDDFKPNLYEKSSQKDKPRPPIVPTTPEGKRKSVLFQVRVIQIGLEYVIMKATRIDH